MSDPVHAPAPTLMDDEEEEISLLDLVVPLAEHWRLLLLGSLLAGLTALGIAYLIAPTYTARTSFLPPQQQQSSAASALSALGSLGSLGSLAGLSGAGIKSPADQYVAMMQSATVSDRLIDQFKLLQVYDKKFRVDARKALASNVRITVGKKDGLITVEVDDEDPQRAADLANKHIDELRRLSSQLALTEAQQRRVFFEAQLQQTRDRLTQAQQVLQESGFNQGALKAEPKAAAEGYAKLKAELTAAEVRLQTMRRGFADTSAEVQQQQTVVGALRAQLGRVEQSSDLAGGPDYVTKYREFKYQETLFELFARQYELARVDESREGALIQVVDPATPPEKKSKPERALIAVAATLVAFLLLAGFVLLRSVWRNSASDPRKAEQIERLRMAWHRR